MTGSAGVSSMLYIVGSSSNTLRFTTGYVTCPNSSRNGQVSINSFTLLATLILPYLRNTPLLLL
nr:MAG TPA: hypothetical protein [Caudoviricetes sp.]